MCAAKCDVRFTPNSDRKSRHAANGHVRFTPESGRVRRKPSCLLWAKSGHCSDHSEEKLAGKFLEGIDGKLGGLADLDPDHACSSAIRGHDYRAAVTK
jgi:hypothetical protein